MFENIFAAESQVKEERFYFISRGKGRVSVRTKGTVNRVNYMLVKKLYVSIYNFLFSLVKKKEEGNPSARRKKKEDRDAKRSRPRLACSKCAAGVDPRRFNPANPSIRSTSADRSIFNIVNR